MATSGTIDAGMCERLITAATRSCVPPAQAAAPVAPSSPNWDATATSLTALSAAFTWGSILLALVAIVAAVGWGFWVRHWAEREARKEAAECVDRLMNKWLAEEAPQIIRKNVELLQNASFGSGDDDAAADEMGKEAG